MRTLSESLTLIRTPNINCHHRATTCPVMALRVEFRESGRVIYQIEESRISKDGVSGAFQAVCPELLITAFGDTAEDARDALRQQVADYLEDCDNLGVLDETLIDAGFYFEDGVWISSEVRPVDGPDIMIF